MQKSIIIFLCLLCGFFTFCKGQNAPMSCKIKGRVVSIIKSYDPDTGSVCSKHPCRAKVKIMDVSERGSAVSLPINPGDIVEMQFAYTLDNTSKVFPKMKAHFPGLKKGAIFSALAIQRLEPGTGGVFVVNAYEKVKTDKGRKGGSATHSRKSAH